MVLVPTISSVPVLIPARRAAAPHSVRPEATVMHGNPFHPHVMMREGRNALVAKAPR